MMMSYSLDFKLRVLRKLAENEIENRRRIYCPLRMSSLKSAGRFKGACAVKCSKFDFEKFENSMISILYQNGNDNTGKFA